MFQHDGRRRASGFPLPQFMSHCVTAYVPVCVRCPFSLCFFVARGVYWFMAPKRASGKHKAGVKRSSGKHREGYRRPSRAKHVIPSRRVAQKRSFVQTCLVAQRALVRDRARGRCASQKPKLAQTDPKSKRRLTRKNSLAEIVAREHPVNPNIVSNEPPASDSDSDSSDTSSSSSTSSVPSSPAKETGPEPESVFPEPIVNCPEPSSGPRQCMGGVDVRAHASQHESELSGVHQVTEQSERAELADDKSTLSTHVVAKRAERAVPCLDWSHRVPVPVCNEARRLGLWQPCIQSARFGCNHCTCLRSVCRQRCSRNGGCESKMGCGYLTKPGMRQLVTHMLSPQVEDQVNVVSLAPLLSALLLLFQLRLIVSVPASDRW